MRNLSKFIESVRVRFRGGKGGDGCIAMLHLFANEMAGPSGGNGGNGGHVVLRADSQMKSFNSIQHNYHGFPGERAHGKNQYGRSAEHTFVPVPLGTLVLPGRPPHIDDPFYNPDESQILAELDEEGSLFIAARGGSGGRGNASFLSNSNRHPGLAELGAKGEDNYYELRMKYYAHVALLGMPNAGKSTLLRTLTGAQVKIGDYAFTTLHPQVGVIEFDDYAQVTISDLPGLVEESHKNRGMGVQFLRSLRRCSCLLYVIDMSWDPIHQYETLVSEINSHNEKLSLRPSAVLANKIDQPGVEDNMKRLIDHLELKQPDITVIQGSGQRGDGLESLRAEIKRLYELAVRRQELL